MGGKRDVKVGTKSIRNRSQFHKQQCQQSHSICDACFELRHEHEHQLVTFAGLISSRRQLSQPSRQFRVINHPPEHRFHFALIHSALIWLQSLFIREFEMSSLRWLEKAVIFNPFFSSLKLSLQNTATKRNDEKRQFRLMENFHKFRPF